MATQQVVGQRPWVEQEMLEVANRILEVENHEQGKDMDVLVMQAQVSWAEGCRWSTSMLFSVAYGWLEVVVDQQGPEVLAPMLRLEDQIQQEVESMPVLEEQVESTLVLEEQGLKVESQR